MSTECTCCKARFVKFRLLQDLSTADYRQEAKVLAYWDGENPVGEGETFYVYNLVTKTQNDEQPPENQGPSEWAYAAPAGATGYAILDDQNTIVDGGDEEEQETAEPPNYRIVEMAAATMGFATLIANLETGKAAEARLRVRSDSDDGWKDSTETATLYASPLWPSNYTLQSGTVVQWHLPPDPRFPHMVATEWACTSNL